MIRLKIFINLRWSKRIIHTSINAPSEFPFLDYWSWSFSIYSWWFRWIFETMTPGQTTSVMGLKWLWVPAFMVTKILMTKGHQQQISIITLCLCRSIFRKPLPTITHSQSCIMHCCTVHWFGLVKPSLNKKITHKIRPMTICLYTMFLKSSYANFLWKISPRKQTKACGTISPLYDWSIPANLFVINT